MDLFTRLVLDEFFSHVKHGFEIPDRVFVILEAIALTHHAHNFRSVDGAELGQLRIFLKLLRDEIIHVAHGFLPCYLVWALVNSQLALAGHFTVSHELAESSERA